MMLREFGVYDLILRNAHLHPQREALVQGDVRLTFAEYLDKCDRLAAGLVRAGLEKGDRLAVMSQNRWEFMLLYGAAAKMGAIIVPVNWRFNQDELDYVIADVAPKLVFSGPLYLEAVAAAADKIDSVAGRFSFGGPAEGYAPFEDLLAEGPDRPMPPVSADDGYLIMHTAAVAGRPRGALLSQTNLIALNLIAVDQYRVTADDCHICLLPLFHIAALTVALSVMHVGGKNVILERFDPAAALAAIESEAGTIFFSFPPMLDNLADQYHNGDYDISSLRIISGINPPETIERFGKIAPQVRFGTLFGQTESMHVTLGWYDEKPDSAGRITLLSRVKIVDDDDNEVPLGAVGEICVRSPGVFLGYWGLEDDTAYTFRNGWHHTGDMGRLDENGFLYYAGRKPDKELIKTGGENVYPAEVEQAALEHPAIAEVSVIGVPDEEWGEAIKAVCVLEPGQSASAEEVIEFVAAKVARYKKPRHVVFVDALPKKADGRIDRAKVKEEHGGLY